MQIIKNLFCSFVTCMLLAMPSFAIEEQLNQIPVLEDVDLNLPLMKTDIQKGQLLYLSDCIKIAVVNSPEIKKAEKNYKIAKTDIGLAKSDYFPTIGATVNYLQRYNSDMAYDKGTMNNSAPAFGVYLSQLIYNFGKTGANIKMRKFNMLSSEYAYLNTVCNTINNVKLKYCTVLQAKAILEVERKNVEITEKMMLMTKKFYEQKKKSKMDYINAQAFLSDAKMSLEDAENFYNQSFADLGRAMYIAGTPDFEIRKIDIFDYYDAFFTPKFLMTPKGKWHEIQNRPREEGLGEVQPLPFSLDKAYDVAFKNSPDLMALNATLDAMKQSVKYTKRQYLPVIGARVGYDYDHRYRNDSELTFSNSQFNVAVGMNFSANAMKYYNDVKRAQTIVAKTEDDIDLLKQNMYFNVKKCYLEVKSSERQIENAKDKVNKAFENLTLTNSEYIAGRVGYLELQTARMNYNSAKIDFIKDVYDYNTSLANLENETHKHIEDIYLFAQDTIKNSVLIKKPKRL